MNSRECSNTSITQQSNQTLNQRTNQWTKQHGNHLIDKHINQPINHSINQQSMHPTNESANQLINWLINQLTNLWTNKSQSSIQPNDQWANQQTWSLCSCMSSGNPATSQPCNDSKAATRWIHPAKLNTNHSNQPLKPPSNKPTN